MEAMHRLFGRAPFQVVRRAPDHTLLWATPGVLAHLGLAPDALPAAASCYAMQRPELLEALRPVTESVPAEADVEVPIGPDGATVRVMAWAVHDADGEIESVVSFARPVAARRWPVGFELWLDTFPHDVYVFSRSRSRWVHMNRSASERIARLGADAPNALGPDTNRRLLADASVETVDAWHEQLVGGGPCAPVVVRSGRDGEYLLLSIIDSPPGTSNDLRLVSVQLLGDVAPAQRPLVLPEVLSDREREIVGMLLGGLRVAGIAERLDVSPHTVRNHLRSIFSKMSVRSQAELIERLREPEPSA